MVWNVVDEWKIERAHDDIARKDSSFEVRNKLRSGWSMVDGGEQLWGEDVNNHTKYQLQLAGLGVDYAAYPFPSDPRDMRFIDLYNQVTPPNQVCQAIGSSAVIITAPHGGLRAYASIDNNMYFYDATLERWVQMIPRKADIWKYVKSIEIWVNVPYWPAASKSYIRVLFDGQLWQGKIPVVKHMQSFYQNGLPNWTSETVPQLHLASSTGVFADVVYENNNWALKLLNSQTEYDLSGGVFAITYDGYPSRPDMNNFTFSITLDVKDAGTFAATSESKSRATVQPMADVVNDPVKFTSGINFTY